MLCHLCEAFIRDILGDCTRENRSWNENQELNYGSLGHLFEHAGSGTCDICSLILQAHYFGPLGRPDLLGPSPRLGTVSVFQPQFNHTSTASPWNFDITTDTRPLAPPFGIMTRSYEFFSFDSSGCSPCPRSTDAGTRLNQLDINLSNFASSALVNDISHQADSQACIAMMRQWSVYCLHNHPSCSRRKQDQRLPTRVLDVGTGDRPREPYLFEANGQRGTYVTLSHRWGTMSKQFRTTKGNLHNHKFQIRLHEFPTLFQDAIKVTRLLGVQYLWIDCLCIVQDDDDEWQRECEKMASIYENSFLTISALLATHNGQGLFPKRSEKARAVYLRMLNGTIIGLRPSTPGLTTTVKHSVMDTRGWILQERVLSPALLHYGDCQMFWECSGGQASEVFPVVQSHSSSWIKNLLDEAQRPGCELFLNGHYIAWYIMVMTYTRKELTVETDRLPAILGLAACFKRTFGGTFVAGLWFEDFHRGLLWRETFAGEGGIRGQRKRGTEALLPSWSWIKCGNRVDFEWDESRSFPSRIHPVARIASDTDAEFIDAITLGHRSKHRGAIKGFIQMWGTVKRVRWMSREHKDSGTRLDSDLGPVPHMFSRKIDVLQTRRKTVDLELPCVMDLDFETPTDCYCVIIADWVFEDSWKEFGERKIPMEPLNLRCYLVLQRTTKARRHRNPLDLGEFKRIGCGAASIASVEHFWGQQRKYFLTLV